jgi:SAM-dependent methyltransferase
MRRMVIPELLDNDAGTPREIDNALGDLRRINRWFGGVSTTKSLLRQVAGRMSSTEFSVLDVGAGPGEALLAARRELAKNGVDLRIALLDRRSTHLPRNGVPTVVGDALSLPFAPGSFDVVTCSLFVHHLEADDVLRFVNEALRVSRIAVIINDLERSAGHLALIYAGFPLFRSRLTRHDAVASVRRAYTASELQEIVSRSTARGLDLSHHFLFRVGIILWKDLHA